MWTILLSEIIFSRPGLSCFPVEFLVELTCDIISPCASPVLIIVQYNHGTFCMLYDSFKIQVFEQFFFFFLFKIMACVQAKKVLNFKQQQKIPAILVIVTSIVCYYSLGLCSCHVKGNERVFVIDLVSLYITLSSFEEGEKKMKNK